MAVSLSNPCAAERLTNCVTFCSEAHLTLAKLAANQFSEALLLSTLPIRQCPASTAAHTEVCPMLKQMKGCAHGCVPCTGEPMKQNPGSAAAETFCL